MVSRAFSALCVYSKFGHHPHPHRLSLCLISFLSRPPCELTPGEKSRTHSLNHSLSLGYLMPRERKRRAVTEIGRREVGKTIVWVSKKLAKLRSCEIHHGQVGVTERAAFAVSIDTHQNNVTSRCHANSAPVCPSLSYGILIYASCEELVILNIVIRRRDWLYIYL